MKKTFIFLLCCAAVAGCTGQSDMVFSEKNISMKVFENTGYRLTKGAVVEDLESIDNFGAAVYCGNELAVQYTSANKIQGEENLWSFSGGARLLYGNTFTCYALSPTNQEGRSGLTVTQDGVSFSYSLPSCNSSIQKDMLMAVSTISVDKSDDTAVFPLHFEHPLSSVKIQVRGGLEGVSISHITLAGLSSSAVCSTTDGNYFIWSNHSGKAEYEMDGDDDTFIIIPQTLGPGAIAIIDITENGTPKRSVNPINGLTLEPGHTLTFSVGKEGELTLVGNSAIDFTNESEDIFQ